MLFRRKRPASILFHLRNLVWPRAGWRRTLTYMSHRLSRLPGSPYSIAAGLACGVAISFTPLLGFHFLLGALLAWVMGGNLLASALGTVVGNPWTFPIIWVWIFSLGNWIMGASSLEFEPANEFTMTFLRDNVVNVFLPMLLGGIPTAIVVWLATYFPVRYLVAGYQRARRARLARKAKIDSGFKSPRRASHGQRAR